MGFFERSVEDMEAKRDVRGLIAVLTGKNDLECKRAAVALGKIGEPSVEPLLKALKDKDTRYWAAIALGYTGDASVVEPLIEVLKEEHWLFRAGAVMALGSIGDARAVEPLIEALKEENWSVRMVAAKALGQIGDKAAVPALTIALGDSEPYVREASAEALANMGVDEEATRDAVLKPLKESVEYFECDVPSGDGVCSDNDCPCREDEIPRGTGYLYIDQTIVDFRRKYRTINSARAAMQQKQESMRASGMMFTGFYRLGPILVCEEGAKLRNLNLEVAAADAKYWWETGKVPLRATPTVEKPQRDLGKKQGEEVKPEKVRCERCGALETKTKATHLGTQGWVCEKCDRELTQEIMKDMGRP